jgi:hypothetical protein
MGGTILCGGGWAAAVGYFARILLSISNRSGDLLRPLFSK